MTRLLKSAAYRIAIAYAVIFALTIAGLGTAVYFAADYQIRRQQDANILMEANELKAEFGDFGRENLRRLIDQREASGTINPYSYGLFDASGRRLAGGLTTGRPKPGWHDIAIPRAGRAATPARQYAIDLAGNLRLVIALDARSVQQIDRTILALCLAAVAVAGLIGVIGAILLGAYLRERLEAIGATARAIVRGDLSHRVPVSRLDDEFDQLGSAVNAMLDRIDQLLGNLRQVSSDVAHDLRTPLARLRGEIELALAGSPDPAALQLALDRALNQSDDLLRLFSAILRISEVEGGLARSFAPVDISALVEDLCDSYAPAVIDSGRTIDAAVAAGLEVNGDRELISQALINLLDNAQRHTPPGTTITLTAARDGPTGAIAICVADNGPGVATADHKRMVLRFVRLDASRSTAGHGLGLNLVAAIAHAHHGTLAFSDNGPGLRATLSLPGIAT
ncbi:MAG: hypothetical protein B7Y45_08440 [Sphingomonas sp. 28-66-16]|nr:MAG: hypothetical protein B7Y45_08440 [Sphingomonas sp. 28-66-16]